MMLEVCWLGTQICYDICWLSYTWWRWSCVVYDLVLSYMWFLAHKCSWLYIRLFKVTWHGFERMSPLAWFQMFYVHVYIFSTSGVLTHISMFLQLCRFWMLSFYKGHLKITWILIFQVGRSSPFEDDATIELLDIIV